MIQIVLFHHFLASLFDIHFFTYIKKTHTYTNTNTDIIMVTIEEVRAPAPAPAPAPRRDRLPIQDTYTHTHTSEFSDAAAATTTTTSPLLSPFEAQALVKGLKFFTLQDVGSSIWLKQHQVLERLNMQAHQSARQGSGDEFVLEALVSEPDKMTCLIHDLILLDCWKEKMWPTIKPPVIARQCTMRAYFILFHEATLVNLLEVLLYHLHACETAGDALLDLIDYCVGKMNWLNSGGAVTAGAGGASRSSNTASTDKDVRARAAPLANRDPAEHLQEQAQTIHFQVAITAVGILRLLCGHLEHLPLSVCTRLVHTHDVPLGLVPLIENPPWTRRTKKKTNEKEKTTWEKLFPDFQWQPISTSSDLLLLTKHEAEPWLALFHLLASPEARRHYYLNRFRKGQLLRVRKYLTEVLVDQLPVLGDIRRFLDELALLEVPEPTAAGGGGAGGSGDVLLVEQVAELRVSILGKEGEGLDKWEALAKAALAAHFAHVGGDARDKDLAQLAAIYTSEWVEEVVAAGGGGGGGGKGATAAGGGGGMSVVLRPCSQCGKEASKRCGRCGTEWYCSRACQVGSWKAHKPVCDIVARAASKEQQQEQREAVVVNED